MSDDPATWANASETPDMAGLIDSFDDLCREIIAEQWHGGRPNKGAVNIVLNMVHSCIRKGIETGHLESDKASQVTVAKLLSGIEASNNPGLYIACLKFVFNLEPRSQTQIAAQYNCERANVSRICISIRDEYDVHPGRGMRSDEARIVYQERAKRVHKLKPATIKPIYEFQSIYASAVA